MINTLYQYLDNIRHNLRVDPSSVREIISELETHIEDELQEMRESGMSEEEAGSACMNLLGSTKIVTQQIYEAHSQGTWGQALLAAMPHLLFSLLFALNWWQGEGWLIAILILGLSVIAYGWRYGRPTWLFPWLGYSLLPVAVAGIALFYLPKGWSWLALLLYIPLVMGLLYFITIQSIKRDWLYGSLMLLPIPVITSWFLVVKTGGTFPEYSVQYIRDFAPWIGLSFLTLAISVVIFIRLRQRWLKASVLLIPGLITLTIIAFYTGGRLSIPALLVLTLVMLNLFFIPALLDHKIRHSR
ncbi:hypothetical protein ACFLVM_03445 [Chloroflexota bacterium]